MCIQWDLGIYGIYLHVLHNMLDKSGTELFTV